MKRSRLIPLSVALFGLAACSASDSTAPAPKAVQPPEAAAFDRSGGAYHDGFVVPGSLGNAGSAPAPGNQHRLSCNIEAPLHGSAKIGPNGGILLIGKNVLIVPPGALTREVEISGTVSAGNEFKIDFQPHGLQFKKPAGLILDASDCGRAPNVIYLDEQGGIAQRITAIFSNWWHLIAAPLDHFSTYMIDV